MSTKLGTSAHRFRLSAATLALSLTITLGNLPAHAAPTLACGYINESSFTAPPEKPWQVLATEPVVDAAGMPLRAFAGYMVDNAILQNGNTTYIGYFNQDGLITVASKTGNGAWQAQTLDENLTYDSHAKITLALDKNGNLHVAALTAAGNDRGLRYWLTGKAGDISTLARSRMIPTFGERPGGVLIAYEDIASYPEFYTGPDGRLYFRFQAGWVGGAYTAVFQFNPTSRSWELSDPATGLAGLAIVFNGWSGTPARNAYPSPPVKGPDGKYHMYWTWRSSGSADTGSELHYAVSSDLKVWKNARGESVIDAWWWGDGNPNTQFYPGQKSTMVDNVPEGGGLLNGDAIGIGFDADGKPVITYAKYAESGSTQTTQLFMARPNPVQTGNIWNTQQVTSWTGTRNLAANEFGANILTANAGVKVEGNYLTTEYICMSQAHKLYLEPKTGRIVADIPVPPAAKLPDAVFASTFAPGYKITTRTFFEKSATPTSAMLLRWDGGPYIHDGDLITNVGPYPIEGSPLTVFRIMR
ncbi:MULTISPECIES: BNR-4 repeat-containing protein [unclassified Serratia (in: enterobacteria)]|uniref:BNR-4 repeat-containing protein n=1 Tax=unclassified Serratia (in: enterobacteria) TaxID=2647522 RepID=UPI00137700BE|nr:MULTISPECIES: BNR-4 repeat-containing protein [unclassified Serratia (in: enterobacteria)]